MGIREERIRVSISTQEMERRWKAVRQVMQERKLDFIIAQNSTDYLAGYVKWLTEISAVHNYPSTVIFPRDDGMTTVWSGPRSPAEPLPPAWSVQGVKKRISVPIIPSLGYSTCYDAEKVVEELESYKNCRIGLVGMGFISAAFYKYITEHLGSAEIEDVTDPLDSIKALKSDEEIQHIREACEIQDDVFDYVLSRVEPGIRDCDIYAEIMRKLSKMGSEQAIVMVGSAPAGTPAINRPIHFCNRVLEEGDQILILMEANGPSGLYGEIMRIICLGKAPSELKEQFEVAKKAQNLTLDLIEPGADPKEIFHAHNAFLRRNGYPEEKRIYAHGQGYDLVERPSLDPGETMKIQARMNIAVHPTVLSDTACAKVCENYIISETGKKECLHKTPQKIFEI